jgi:hypothetical protein
MIGHALSGVFHTIHTMKGTCGFLNNTKPLEACPSPATTNKTRAHGNEAPYWN